MYLRVRTQPQAEGQSENLIEKKGIEKQQKKRNDFFCTQRQSYAREFRSFLQSGHGLLELTEQGIKSCYVYLFLANKFFDETAILIHGAKNAEYFLEKRTVSFSKPMA